MAGGPKIRCLNCGDIIQSMHQHDFVACSCFRDDEKNKGVAIDGGSSYTRIIGSNFNWEYVKEY